MIDTYKVTMPDGREYNFDGNADGHATPLQFVQDIAQLINATPDKSAAGAKVQRIKADNQTKE